MSIQAVVGAVSAIQQNQVETKIATQVAKKQLDAVEQQGQAALELLDAAVALTKTEGIGELLDVKG